MTQSRKTMIFVTVIVFFLVIFLLTIEYAILMSSNESRANRTSAILVDQLEKILSQNDEKKETLVDSLKVDYITRAKAISYLIDSNPELEDDIVELTKVANLMSVDEIHLFDRTGTIYGGTTPQYYGFSFDTGEQISYFRPMLSDTSLTMCQDMTPNTAEGKEMMYAICWNEDGTRMVQVGIAPARLLEAMRENEIAAVVEGMPAYSGIDMLVADRESHVIGGATVAGYIGQSLRSIGLEGAEDAAQDIRFFRAELAGRVSYCAVHEYGDYLIVVAQDSASVNQSVPMTLLLVLLYLAMAAAIIVYIVKRMTRSIREEQRNANVDHMTGLLNRRAYENGLLGRPEIPCEENFTYISVDMNGLKQINDTLGHAAGDRCLQGVAACMKSCLEEYGEVYRMGGDEFAAVVFVDDERLTRLKAELQEALARWSQENGMTLSISLGHVQKKEFPEKTVKSLAQISDARMYQDKERYYRESGLERRIV